jgi:PLP dependent protein
MASPAAAACVRVVAASKGQPLEKIAQAIAQGITAFGENRVQEAQTKWPTIKARHPSIELQLIGPLQTNKLKDALRLFDSIATLDRPRLAEALAREYAAHNKRPELLIQVNTGEEPQKAGVLPQDADAFIRYCMDTLKLPVIGLMCIPPAGARPAPHFALLNTIAQRHGLKELSMGMSADWQQAVALGATQIRLGTALFGVRKG